MNRDLKKTNPGLYMAIKKEKKDIRAASNAAGLGIVGYLVISTTMSFIMAFTPFMNLYMTDPAAQSAINIFYSVFSLIIPFGIAGICLQHRSKTEVFRFERPVSYPLMFAAVPFGFFFCMVANYITNWFVTFTAMGGAELTSPEYTTPDNIYGRIVFAVSIALIPALVEEFSIRGAIMQPMRKQGDLFAIIASAIVFAVLHGNLIQAPFAFMVGVIIGYAVCVTGSVWTGVLIHFCNNFYSVMVEFMVADITNEEKLNAVYNVTQIVLYAVSIIGSVIFVILKFRNKAKLQKRFTLLDGTAKMRIFILTAPMIIALILLVILTSSYVNVTNGKIFALYCLWWVLLTVIISMAVAFVKYIKKRKKSRLAEKAEAAVS